MRTFALLSLTLLAFGGLVVAAPAASADAWPPECYDVYNEWRVGPVTVVQRSSCDYEVRVD